MPIGGSSGGLSSAGPGAGGGAQGPQGAQGNQGTQGHQGTQGNQGTQGSGGAQGTQGTQGNTGAQGPQGATGGGSTPGAAIIRKFPFAFDTAGILTGAALYTPTVGDILLDAWIEIDTAWDGTTPFGDFGTFVGGGILANGYTGNTGAFDMTVHDVTVAGLLVSSSGANDAKTITTGLNAVTDSLSVVATTLTPAAHPSGARWFPGKFPSADPIKIVVSQDGTNTGADPGSTQGAAVLYLVTATPA